MAQRDDHFIVTGASQGIGQAIAERLAADGARLSLLARNEDALGNTAQRCQTAGARATRILVVDITDQARVDAEVDAAAAELGPVRALIAASGLGGANEPGPDDRFARIIDTNVNGTYHCVRAAERHLADGTTHVVIIASVLARFGVPGYTGYCTSKAALLGMVRAFAMELAERNVQVNAICPGWVNTKMARDGIEAMADESGTTYDEAYADAMSRVPLGTMSEPHEIAAMVAWLTSDQAVGITGQGLDINHGAWM